MASQAGSVWYNNLVQVNQNMIFALDFAMTQCSSGPADGFVVGLQNSSNSFLGEPGGAKGFYIGNLFSFFKKWIKNE